MSFMTLIPMVLPMVFKFLRSTASENQPALKLLDLFENNQQTVTPVLQELLGTFMNKGSVVGNNDTALECMRLLIEKLPGGNQSLLPDNFDVDRVEALEIKFENLAEAVSRLLKKGK